MQIVYWRNELLTREETNTILKPVSVTIFAVGQKYLLNVMSVCPYSCLSYPACKGIVFFGLSGSTIFFHSLINGTIFEKKCYGI